MTIAIFAMLAILLVPVIAFAASLDPISDPSGFAGVVLEAIRTSNWKLLAVLVIIVAVAAIRMFSKKESFWRTDRGGAILVLLAGITSSVAAVLLNDQGASYQMLIDGIVMGFTTAGGYAVLKKIIFPSDKSLGGGKGDDQV